MKKLLILIAALFAVSTLSAQTYKVGDYYDVDGKKGVVFDVSEDGKHGLIIDLTEPTSAESISWYKAMEWSKGLKDGWYIPSLDELITLVKVCRVVDAKLKEVGTGLTWRPYTFYWASTEFGADFAWIVSLGRNSWGGSCKSNDFCVRAVSKF
jgi:hypothetical protein